VPEGGIGELHSDLRHIFATGEMRLLATRLFETGSNWRALPEGVGTKEELDTWLSERRLPLLMQSCQDGVIRPADGSRRDLVALLERGIPAALYTGGRESIAMPMCHYFFDRQGDALDFDDLIRPSRRVFGVDLGVESKPNPKGWLVAAEKLGLPPEKVLVIDDHSTVLACAASLKKFGYGDRHFAGVVGLYRDKENIPQWMKWVSGEDYAPKTHRILVRDLSKIVP
jgi:phosphoglycolate phosphatase-like HAD superfamily hydrolase